MIRVVIPYRTPSGNRSTFGSRWTYMKERDHWYALVRLKLSPVPRVQHRVRVSLVTYRNRLLDEGNLVAGMKPIPDMLVKLGYLHDDSPRWCRIVYRQVQVPRRAERTVIIIHNPQPEKGCEHAP